MEASTDEESVERSERRWLRASVIVGAIDILVCILVIALHFI